MTTGHMETVDGHLDGVKIPVLHTKGSERDNVKRPTTRIHVQFCSLWRRAVAGHSSALCMIYDQQSSRMYACNQPPVTVCWRFCET